MVTRQEKLDAEGETGSNPHKALLPKIEALQAEARAAGVHAGIVDHLDECAFLCKRDIKQKDKQTAVATGRPV